MDIGGRDYERIAMCAHPEGTHAHVPLKPGEDPPETCFTFCECEPVVFVRADIHQGAVEALEQIRDLLGELREERLTVAQVAAAHRIAADAADHLGGAGHDGDHGRDEPILDYPTAWAIQREGVEHTDPRCSAVQTNGALLCDCGAVEAEWERRNAR